MLRPFSYRRALVVALAMVSLFAGGCGNRAKSGSADGATKKLISSDGTFEMRVPTSWQQTANLNDVAVLQAANRSEEAYALLVADPKGPFEGTPLSTFADTQIKKFQESLTSPKLSGPKSVTVDGKKATQYEIAGTAEGVEVIYLFTFIETPDNFLKVLAWSLAKDFDDNEAALSKVASSVQQVKTTEQSPEPDSTESAAPEGDSSASPSASPSTSATEPTPSPEPSSSL